MCDVREYSKIFTQIKKLTPDDTAQIIMESDDEKEKAFYEMIGDYLLQNKQKEVVERKLF